MKGFHKHNEDERLTRLQNSDNRLLWWILFWVQFSQVTTCDVQFTATYWAFVSTVKRSKRHEVIYLFIDAKKSTNFEIKKLIWYYSISEPIENTRCMVCMTTDSSIETVTIERFQANYAVHFSDDLLHVMLWSFVKFLFVNFCASKKSARSKAYQINKIKMKSFTNRYFFLFQKTLMEIDWMCIMNSYAAFCARESDRKVCKMLKLILNISFHD